MPESEGPKEVDIDKEIKDVEEKVEEQMSAEDYFNAMGLDSTIEKNDFGIDEAEKIFLQAAKEVKEQKATQRKVKSYVKYAWSIFNTLRKLA